MRVKLDLACLFLNRLRFFEILTSNRRVGGSRGQKSFVLPDARDAASAFNTILKLKLADRRITIVHGWEGPISFYFFQLVLLHRVVRRPDGRLRSRCVVLQWPRPIRC